jgi:hypothetical protein
MPDDKEFSGIAEPLSIERGREVQKCRNIIAPRLPSIAGSARHPAVIPHPAFA